MAKRSLENPEQIVSQLRAMKAAHPKMFNREIIAALGMEDRISRSMASSIIRNMNYYDPNYTPPPNQHYQTRQNRRASIDFPCTCPTCGMGADTFAEADECCKIVREYEANHMEAVI